LPAVSGGDVNPDVFPGAVGVTGACPAVAPAAGVTGACPAVAPGDLGAEAGGITKR